MPEQLADEPLTIIRGLIDGNWNAANMEYSGDPLVHTGWWDWDRPTLEVTVTNPQSNPTGPGGESQTGYTHLTGDGRVGQVRQGFCLVNAWGGTFESAELAGEASDGSRLSPKINAWQMHKEIKRILRDHASGTLTDSGDVELLYVGPGEARRIVESDNENEHPTLFRYEVECRFGYIEES